MFYVDVSVCGTYIILYIYIYFHFIIDYININVIISYFYIHIYYCNNRCIIHTWQCNVSGFQVYVYICDVVSRM